MEVVVNTTTTFMVTGLMAPATDRWPVVDAAKVTRESTARWPYVGQVVPTVVTVSIRMFVRVLMDILEPDVKQLFAILVAKMEGVAWPLSNVNAPRE
jgi:hypothetical protein